MAASSTSAFPKQTAAAPALVPQGQHQGKPALPLGRAFTLIGSRNRAHLHLVSKSVSKSHAAIISTDAGLYVRDLASRERVYINGKAVREGDLKDGDLLKVGSFLFKYVDPTEGERPRANGQATEAVLHVEGAETPFPLEGRTIIIGRRPTADVSLTELSASTIHAIIFEVDGSRYIRDLGSRTGTFVNGRPIHHHPLQLNDRIKVGETEMYLTAAGAEAEEDLGRLLTAEQEPPAAEAPAAPAPQEAAPEPSVAARDAARRALEQVNRAGLEPELQVAQEAAPEHPAPASEEEELMPLASEQAAPAEAGFTASQPAPPAPEPLEFDLAPEGTSSTAQAQPAAVHQEFDDGDLDIFADEPAASVPTAAEKLTAAPEQEHPEALGKSESGLTTDEYAASAAAVQPALDAEEVHPANWSQEPDFPAAPAIHSAPAESRAMDEPTQQAEPPEDIAAEAPAPTVAHESAAIARAAMEPHDLAEIEPGVVAGTEPPEAPEDLSASHAVPLAPIDEPPVETHPVESGFTASVVPVETELPPVSEPEPDVPAVALYAVEDHIAQPPGVIQPAPFMGVDAPAPVLEPIAEAAPVVQTPPIEEISPSKKGRKKREPKAPAARGRKKKSAAKGEEVAPIEPAAEAAPIEPMAEIAPLEPTAQTSPVIEPAAEPVPEMERSPEPGIEAPPAAPAPHFAPVEVLDESEPTPDSALALEARLGESAEEPAAPLELEIPAADALSDTTFGKQVAELSSVEAGPLVEHAADAEILNIIDAVAPVEPVMELEPAALQPDAPDILDVADAAIPIDQSIPPVEPFTDVIGAEPHLEVAKSEIELPSEEDEDISAPVAEAMLAPTPAELQEDLPPVPREALDFAASVESHFETIDAASEAVSPSASPAAADPALALGASAELGRPPMDLEALDLEGAFAETDEAQAPEFADETHIADERKLARDAHPDLQPPAAQETKTAPPASLETAPPVEAHDVVEPDLAAELGLDLGDEELSPADAGLAAIEDELEPIGLEPVSGGQKESALGATETAATPGADDVAGLDDLAFEQEIKALADAEKKLASEIPTAPPAPAAPPPQVPPTVTTAKPPALAPPAEAPRAAAAASAPSGPFAVAQKADKGLGASDGGIPPASLDSLLSGMSRDVGSFLGGIPLGMGPVKPPPGSPPGKGVVISVKKDPPAPPAPVKPGTVGKPPSPDDSGMFENMTEALDNLPDSLEEISDETEVLGEKPPSVPAPQGKAPAPAAPGKPSVAAPPARGARRPAEAPLGHLNDLAAQLPPFGAPRGKPGGAFDGLALPPVQQIDVFSMLPVPAADDPFLGGVGASPGAAIPGASQKPAPAKADVPARPRPVRPAQPTMPAKPAPPDARPASAAPSPAQSAAPPTGPAPAAPAEPPKRRLFKFFGSLFLTLGLAAATYFYWPARHHLQATLNFEGMERLSKGEQANWFSRLRDQIANDSVRRTARDRLANSSSNPGDGFLDDQVEMEHLKDTAILDAKRNRLILLRNSIDPAADERRMSALLTAMYVQNQHLSDSAASAAHNLHDDKDRLTQNSREIQVLQARRTEEAQTIGQREAAAQIERTRFQKVQSAEKMWLTAAQKATQLQDDLEQLEAGSAALAADPQVKELSEKLKKLNDTLALAGNQQGQDAGKAAAQVTTALAEFRKQIDGARAGIKDNSPSSPYLVAADQAHQQAGTALSELMDRQKADQQSLADLKLRLSEQSEARLKSTIAADPQLVPLQQRLEMLQRQANTAADSNLTDDAKRLTVEVDAVRQQIDRRRDELAKIAGPQEQKLVDDLEQSTRQDRARGLSRLREPLQLMETAMPAADALTAGERQTLGRVRDAARQVQSAADQLAMWFDASSPAGQTRLRGLESQRVDLSAQLDARRKELAEQNGGIASTEAQTAAVNRKRADLEAARRAEALALSVRNSARKELDQAHAELAALPAMPGSLAADDQRLSQLQQEQKDLSRRISELEASPEVVPVDPARSENAILVDSPDPTPRRAATAAVLILGLIGSFLWSRSGRQVPAEAMTYIPSNRQLPVDLAEHQAIPA